MSEPRFSDSSDQKPSLSPVKSNLRMYQVSIVEEKYADFLPGGHPKCFKEPEALYEISKNSLQPLINAQIVINEDSFSVEEESSEYAARPSSTPIKNDASTTVVFNSHTSSASKVQKLEMDLLHSYMGRTRPLTEESLRILGNFLLQGDSWVMITNSIILDEFNLLRPRSSVRSDWGSCSSTTQPNLLDDCQSRFPLTKELLETLNGISKITVTTCISKWPTTSNQITKLHHDAKEIIRKMMIGSLARGDLLRWGVVKTASYVGILSFFSASSLCGLKL